MNLAFKRGMLGVAACVAAFGVSWGQLPENPDFAIFGDIGRDTTEINAVLAEIVAARPASTNEAVAIAGKHFIGVPYVGHTLEGDTEVLRVYTDKLDCTTYAETAAALAKTAMSGRNSWRDFIYNLKNIRYRNGEIDGYASRLHYISDWVANNRYRGNLKDVTQQLPGAKEVIKTVEFMSANRRRYPALADNDSLYMRIKDIESAYKNHRYFHIPTRALGSKDVQSALREGDIVGLTSTLKDLDVTHMGIIVFKDGVPYLMHASSSLGRVTVSDEPLAEFMRRNRHFAGIRVIRLAD